MPLIEGEAVVARHEGHLFGYGVGYDHVVEGILMAFGHVGTQLGKGEEVLLLERQDVNVEFFLIESTSTAQKINMFVSRR